MQLIVYSNRLAGSFHQNAYTALLERKRSAGVSLLDLTPSNPTRTIPAYPHAEIAAALGSIRNFNYCPEPFGMSAGRDALATQLGVAADRIALTASTSEAYSLLFKLLCDPGSEVLVPIPSYPLFEYLAALESVRVVPYPLQYDGAWHIDFPALEARLSPAARAIITVNPNNPTGSFLKKAEAERLLLLAKAHNLPVIADEVFKDYQWADGSEIFPTLIGFDSQISFSLGGLSKSAAMPQMKLGWIVSNGPAPELDQLRPRLELILDTYLSVNTPVQAALAALLQIGQPLRARVSALATTNLAIANQSLAGTPVHLLNTEGGWSAILQLPRIRTELDWVTTLLERESVVVQPGYFFDMPREAFVVVSLITPTDTVRTGLERLRNLVLSECRQ